MHLERLLRILEITALAGGGVSVSEISVSTGYPKPTCYRIVQDLVAAGLLEAESKGRFRLGRRLHRIARLDRNDADIAAIADPLLQDLADRFGVACFVSRLRGEGVEITQVVAPRDAKISFLHPGLGFRPLHACSCAKVIAANAGSAIQNDLLQGPLKRYTEFTQTEPELLQNEFSTIRRQGYGECVQELELGICSVAAPVQLGDLGVSLSVGATGSIRVLSEAYRKKIGRALIGLADELSIELERVTTLDTSNLAVSA